MKTIEEIRLENLVTLRSNFPSERQFAIKLDKLPNQVNQWFGKGAARSIQSESAREVEVVMGKPRGWLDNDHSQLARLTPETIAQAVELLQQANGMITGWRLDFSDPDDLAMLAQSIRVVITNQVAGEESASGSGTRVEQVSRIAGTERAKKAGEESKAAPRRTRKSA
jgi:hypothetical protein